ncbi:unnamed protein product [Amoebophrya sp. A120]|nr:unnamed protein product [Amoebophrya sp. A120]|eukprot:GSA120T00017287001.1
MAFGIVKKSLLSFAAFAASSVHGLVPPTETEFSDEGDTRGAKTQDETGTTSGDLQAVVGSDGSTVAAMVDVNKGVVAAVVIGVCLQISGWNTDFALAVNGAVKKSIRHGQGGVEWTKIQAKCSCVTENGNKETSTVQTATHPDYQHNHVDVYARCKDACEDQYPGRKVEVEECKVCTNDV